MLNLAAAGGYLETAKWVVGTAKRQDPDAARELGRMLWAGDMDQATPLHSAARGGHLLMAEWLIDMADATHARTLELLQSCTYSMEETPSAIARKNGFSRLAAWLDDALDIRLSREHERSRLQRERRLRESAAKEEQERKEKLYRRKRRQLKLQNQELEEATRKEGPEGWVFHNGMWKKKSAIELGTKVAKLPPAPKGLSENMEIGLSKFLEEQQGNPWAKRPKTTERRYFTKKDAENAKVKARARQANTKKFGSLTFEFVKLPKTSKKSLSLTRRSRRSKSSRRKEGASLPKI
jgi:hypothetical protein